MEPMILYWRPGAASMAPHAALAEIGCDYRLVEIDRETAQADAAYRELNPLGLVPTLVVGDDIGRVSAWDLRDVVEELSVELCLQLQPALATPLALRANTVRAPPPAAGALPSSYSGGTTSLPSTS